MKTFELSEHADSDIQEIYLYSENTWGTAQAQQYIDNLFRMFEMFAKRPTMARLREETRIGMRGFKVGSHIVFFVETTIGIGIVRVMHESTDIEHALLGPPFPNQV